MNAVISGSYEAASRVLNQYLKLPFQPDEPGNCPVVSDLDEVVQRHQPFRQMKLVEELLRFLLANSRPMIDL
ncbi:hypothetical protein DITRI_Ditri02bG0055200 [Diplodiscus trichospermus]